MNSVICCFLDAELHVWWNMQIVCRMIAVFDFCEVRNVVVQWLCDDGGKGMCCPCSVSQDCGVPGMLFAK